MEGGIYPARGFSLAKVGLKAGCGQDWPHKTGTVIA